MSAKKRNLPDSADSLKFPPSTPWGYLPSAVDKRIEEYEQALEAVNEKYMEQRRINAVLERENERYREELKEMHLQLSFAQSGSKVRSADNEQEPLIRHARLQLSNAAQDDDNEDKGFEILS